MLKPVTTPPLTIAVAAAPEPPEPVLVNVTAALDPEYPVPLVASETPGMLVYPEPALLMTMDVTPSMMELPEAAEPPPPENEIVGALV